MKSIFPNDERSSIEHTSRYDVEAVRIKVDRGPDKSSFQYSGDYEMARAHYDSLFPEGQIEIAKNELSAGCLIKQLRRGQLDSASPVECDNVGCKANRPDFHTDQVALGSTCLTDARPTDTFNK